MTLEREPAPAPRIAIVGIGGMFPGAPDLRRFWENVSAGIDTSREVPPGRWLLDPEDVLASGVAVADKVHTSRAYYLDEIPTAPDRCLAGLDPVFHLIVHAGRQAFAEAATPGLDRSRVGVILGHIALPTEKASAIAVETLCRAFAEKLGLPNAPSSTDPRNRFVAGLPAGALAHALGLGGGWHTLDAACASSLYALKLAADELRAGRADLMLTGGAARPDCLYTQMGFAQLRALSPRGRCSPFDAAGDGLVVGEGCGVLALKRLDDAVRDGNTIYGVIAGIGLSNDVEGSLLAPASEGQLRAMREAYRQAGWAPSDVDLIECHATGTPVGDAVEFASLRSLWREERWSPGQCVIGSVKSTVGHLLTGAGSAGLIKVLLAMRHGVRPPTANFRTPSRQIDLQRSPFRVLREADPWCRRDDRTPRRAAVSGFGFGGINAHVLIEEYVPEPTRSQVTVPSKPPAEPIAVVGMEARFGPWQSLREFRRKVFSAASGGQGRDPLACAAGSNWSPQRKQGDRRLEPKRHTWGINTDRQPGYFIDEIDVPLDQFRIPPKELEEMLPQQLLMLQVAAAALDDARNWESHRSRAGIFLGLGLDLTTTNFHFRWWALQAARIWRRQQPGEMDEGDFSEWLNGLCNAAHPALNANRTMGALASIAASRIARACQFGGPSFTICSEESSGGSALEAAVRVLQQGELDLALTGAVDFAGDVRMLLAGEPRPAGEGAAAFVLKRLADAQRDGDRIYAVIRGVGSSSAADESLRPANAAASTALRRALLDAGVESEHVEWRDSAELVAHQVGHAGTASFAAALARTCLALHHELLPGPKPRFWLTNTEDGPRRAVVSGAGTGGNHVAVILEEYRSGNLAEPAGAVVAAETLFALEADTPFGLSEEVERLERVAGSDSLVQAAHRWRASAPRRPDASLGAAIVARSVEDLREQIALLRRHLAERPDANLAERVVYTPRPLARGGKLAFVFPGSGNHFAGMGRDLAVRWPQILRRQQCENRRLMDQFAPDRFWNGQADVDPIHAMFGQVTLGCLVSDLLQSFGVRPQAAIGYSLGETAALFALRAWTDRDEMLRRMLYSTLFRSDLAGRCDAARTVWNLGPDEPFEWAIGVLAAPAERVRHELEHARRVYLLIVNTPDECVIGGERRELESFVARLRAPFIPLPNVTIAHCELVVPVSAAYRNLHLLPTTPPAHVHFYSGAWGSAYDLTAESAADAILGHALDTIDYPAVIESAYADGVRLFVEVGPGASCTRMIGRILGDRPHLARSACVPQANEVSLLLRLLAELHAHRVPLDLSPLYDQPIDQPPVSRPTLRIQIGGDPFEIPTPPVPRVPASRDAQRSPLPRAPLRVAANKDAEGVVAVQTAVAEAQSAYLRFSERGNELAARIMAFSNQLLAHAIQNSEVDEQVIVVEPHPALDTAQCREFAVGSIGSVLGHEFSAIDSYPTRVRLPDGPLMLVDNIWEIEGEPRSLASGRVVTDHHVHEGRWYADEGHIPTSICVEAGQADLFLSGYLGIDFVTKGLAVYRLLDAVVTFHRGLPRPGETIRYDIRIDRFFRQGDTHLFRFRFEGTVNGEPLLTMRDGCAGFFTAEELASGKGIVQTALDRRPIPGKLPADWRDLAPMDCVEAYDAPRIESQRAGDLAACFGEAFADLPFAEPLTLPGGMLKFVDRVTELDPRGGRYGLGRIRAEMDIRPDDWFLTCHFVDDMVMPGTLMYECCLHTLRIFLLRLGWVSEKGRVTCEPVPGVASQLKCRGQVIASTKSVTYEVSIKELGYEPEPFAICDALMYADGKPIVEITNMSLRYCGATREEMEALWRGERGCVSAPRTGPVNEPVSLSLTEPVLRAFTQPRSPTKAAPLFDRDRITAFAIGKPSEAFGERYRVFDSERVIARLPGPPFQFLDRIIDIKRCEPWKLAAGGEIVTEYDVPPGEWYFAANRIPAIPFAVLLEIALQPCGWLAAYLGSALTSDVDLAFRNLGGKATQFGPIGPDIGTLSTRVKMTRVSKSGGMIIQNFDFCVSAGGGRTVYEGDTYFGFFTRAALANQVGLREAKLHEPSAEGIARGRSFPIPTEPPHPDRMLRMLDRVDLFVPDGGTKGLGFVRGSKTVNPDEWFFKAHFFQDPVWPGSLGLEAFVQLLKVVAVERWGPPTSPAGFSLVPRPHQWTYRGQVVPTDRHVTVEADVTAIDDASQMLTANGFLCVDGRVIYQMSDFTLQG
jgi:acyl transferase domain-containing protein/3-hydroxymyristoyl/3-hydroxydecanoyl-(acyl carrier protein) dehydratase